MFFDMYVTNQKKNNSSSMRACVPTEAKHIWLGGRISGATSTGSFPTKMFFFLLSTLKL